MKRIVIAGPRKVYSEDAPKSKRRANELHGYIWYRDNESDYEMVKARSVPFK